MGPTFISIYVGNHTGKFQLPVFGLTLPVLYLLLVLSAAHTGTVHPSFFDRHLFSLPTCICYIPSSFHHSSSTSIVSACRNKSSKTMADPLVNPPFNVPGEPPALPPLNVPGDPFVVGSFVIEGVMELNEETRLHVVAFYEQVIVLMNKAGPSWQLIWKEKYDRILAMLIRQRNGEELKELWAEYPQCYKWCLAFAIVKDGVVYSFRAPSELGWNSWWR